MTNAKTFVLLAVIAVSANAGNGLLIMFQHRLARALRRFRSFREHNYYKVLDSFHYQLQTETAMSAT